MERRTIRALLATDEDAEFPKVGQEFGGPGLDLRKRWIVDKITEPVTDEKTGLPMVEISLVEMSDRPS